MLASQLYRITDENKIVRPIIGEALKYLGYKKIAPDEVTQTLIEECEKELLDVINPVCVYIQKELMIVGENQVDIGFGTIESKSLYEHIKKCDSVILMAATIGIDVDRLIAKYGRLSPAKSAVIDALASATIEDWCDKAEEIICKDITSHCSRFSCGYGDFAIEHQKAFLETLDANKKLGITLSSSYLMTPTKSVTAVIGVGDNKRTCDNKCMSCPNETCIYRCEE